MKRTTDAMSRRDGFTLAELLTVLAIIVLLSSIAVVASSSLLVRNRERYAARQVHAAVLQARHYAIASNSTASVVVYQADGFLVVTNAQYEPIAPPVVLPAGCGLSTSPAHTVTDANWTARVGDGPAATTAGYSAGRRPMMVVTFQNDGTVKFVTPLVTSLTGGAIVIGIGGGSLGNLKDGCTALDTEMELTSRGKFESSGMGIMDNEVIRYTVRYSPSGTRVYIYNVARGIFTPARTHRASTAVYAPHEAILIFPLTGGVVVMAG